jgi:O-antigen ligase
VASLLLCAGGTVLASLALSQWKRHFGEVQSYNLTDVVAFRYRLIVPPPPWVLGEWFTLLLLTLPFAFAAPVFMYIRRRKKLAAILVLPPLMISALLSLSCSRAVFWRTVGFFVALGIAGAAFRLVPTKTTLIVSACALCVVALLVLTENACYPGVMAAYVGRHTSQTRSAEGRLAIWKRSAGVFKLSPLWGVGSGNAPLFLAANTGEDQTTGFASRTFSPPVQLLVEQGIVGAALYLAVIVLAGWQGHRKLRAQGGNGVIRIFELP